MKRYKSNGYRGVFYRIAERQSEKGEEKIYYIVFKKNGKVYEEKVGRQYADDMTPAKASRIRSARIDGKVKSRKELREDAKDARYAEASKMTIERLWESYKAKKAGYKSRFTDQANFEHLKPAIGNREPHEIIPLDIDRLRIKLEKTYKPQTIKHVLGLLKRIILYGVSKQLCKPLNFTLETVKVDNQRTEDLTPEQLKRLLDAIEQSPDIQAANMMRLALFTGMRRGEMFKLKWDDIDFHRGFILLRDPKGGVSQKIPLNEPARHVLENHPRLAHNVFVTAKENPFVDIGRRINPIKKAAGLPADFRPLHGLRHTYASMLASSGKVDLYTLQRLLTHKSPVMTQRYAHLRDEALRNASTLAGNIIDQATNSNVIEMHKAEKASS
jgi:integrase